MTIYAHVSTPYGNFAAQTYRQADKPNVLAILLTPIGELEEVPLRDGYPFGSVLDHDALEAEGGRQRPGNATPYLKSSPVYTINGKDYDATLEVQFGTNPSNYVNGHANKPYARINPFTSLRMGDLTDSAKSKLSEWLLTHKDEYLTPKFFAEDEYDRAERDIYYRERDLAEAREACKEAADALDRAREARQEAGESLKGLKSDIQQ